MRQIGARQEAGKVGGIGSCGRELCCSTWLTDFKSVNTTAARYQNLSINQTKLSGQCGRLKCCLNYELDTYLDALQHFPDNADVIQTSKSPAYLVKKDIFKNLMWYTLPDSTKHYPLTIARVKEIMRMNAQGQRPDDLEPVEVVSSKPKEVEPEFVDVVGQISLRSLEKNSRKRERADRDARGGNDRRGNDPRGGNQQRGPQQPQRNGPAQPQQQRGPQPAQQRNRPVQQPQRNPQGPRPVITRNPAATGSTPGAPAPQQGQEKSRPPQQERQQQQQRPPQQRGPQQRPPQNRPPQQESKPADDNKPGPPAQ
jgi:hypothetical protein